MNELADIGALRAFVAVADAGSFSDGARRVGLTRSAAGKAIARLEDMLGARLLHRTTRSVGLTSDGREFLARVVPVLQDLKEAQDAIKGVRSKPRGTLRLTTTEAFGRLVVLPVIAEYLDRWPAVSIETSFTDRVTDLVDEGFDLAIRFGSAPTPPELISRVVTRSRGCVCASPAYLQRAGTPRDIEELDNHRLLVFGTRPDSHPWVLTDGETSFNIPIGSPSMLSDHAGALLDAALAGMGITCLPGLLIQEHVAAGRLRILFPDHATPEVPISVVYPTRRHLSAKVRLFIDLLVSRLNV